MWIDYCKSMLTYDFLAIYTIRHDIYKLMKHSDQNHLFVHNYYFNGHKYQDFSLIV